MATKPKVFGEVRFLALTRNQHCNCRMSRALTPLTDDRPTLGDAPWSATTALEQRER